MFVRDPFDLAPAAQRPTRAAWLLLTIGLLFAATCALVLERSIDAVQRARESVAAQEEAHRLRLQREAAAREHANDPAALAKLRAQQQLQRSLRLSWSGLFDALERAGKKVDGRVSVTSLVPAHSESDVAQVAITGMALNNDALMEYVEALQEQPHIKDAMLTGQEPAQSSGASVSRFRLSITWQPVAGAAK